jgi:hypothetical protein
MTFKNYATRADAHTHRDILGTPCDGCRCMCVIQRGRKIPVTEYWCDHRHRVVNPHEVTCNYRKVDS